MQNNSFFPIVGVLLVLVIGGLVFFNTRDSAEVPEPVVEENNTATTTSGTQATTTPTAGTNTTRLTATEVARHNTRTDCWSIINGSVYDLTSWIPNHPGGEQAILQLCGVDGSVKFNGQHGGAAKQAAVLVGFKLGLLVQ